LGFQRACVQDTWRGDGYRAQAAQILVNGTAVDSGVLVNSGILNGYSIIHAIDAIEIGQPR
jgi:hypothetical protein